MAEKETVGKKSETAKSRTSAAKDSSKKTSPSSKTAASAKKTSSAEKSAASTKKTSSGTKTSPKKGSRKKKKSLATKTISVILKIFLAFGIMLGVIIIAVAGLIFGSLYGYVEDTELVDIENMRLNLTSFVYVIDPETGEEIELEQLYDTENRVWVPSNRIPEHLKNAFVAIEDERFYSHSGVDIKRFAGAAMQYLTNKGDSSYGGSTITQQLIKNLTSDDDYSIKRKIQEAYRAYNLEKELSKDEILEYYLNTIYLSQKCNGVGSASQTYFGKDVSELSLAECASIAGITKFPTKYDPISNPENNKERQEVILRKMKDLGFITKQEYDQAIKEKLVFKKKVSEEKKEYQSYFTDAVIEQVTADLISEYGYTKDYASRLLYNGGLKIYISMDPNMQEIVDSVYNDPEAFPKANGEVQPQSSMVIMDPYTGLVKAMAGGRGAKEGNRTLNRATHTLRQPGSTIKPLSVYTPAIEYGLITPNSIINDAAVTYKEYGNWSPRNDDRIFKGRITVTAALMGSRNVPATKICNYTTTEAAYDFVKNNFHISSLVHNVKRGNKTFTDKGLSAIALGGLTDGASVLDMCAAYCAFPNSGKYIEPSFYTKVVDSKGENLLVHKGIGLPAMSENTARDMVSMLTSAVNGGTGTEARISGMKVAGKTGTTSSKNDRWFVGFTPYYVGAVWFGYDEPAPLNFSGNPAARVWNNVMVKIHENLEDKPFFENDTDGKTSVMICADSGMHVSPSCRNITRRAYSSGNIPTKLCTQHPYTFNKNDLQSGSSQSEESSEGFELDDADTPSADTPSADVPPTDVPSADVPPTDVPPADIPSADTPPADAPSATPPDSGGGSDTDSIDLGI